MPVATILAFRAHMLAIAADEQHVQALWSLLGIDYAAMQAEGRAHAEELARERGWELL